MDGGNIIPLKETTQKDIKGKDFTIGSEYILKKGGKRKGTYPMAPSGGNLLESSVVCSFGESIRDKLEILMLGMHFDMSI